jgi:hypothetical protein
MWGGLSVENTELKLCSNFGPGSCEEPKTIVVYE